MLIDDTLCYITRFLWSTSSSSAITSTSTTTQFTYVISSSTNQTVSRPCDTITVNKSSTIVTSQPSVAVNLLQLSHPKQGECSKVTFSYMCVYIYIYIYIYIYGISHAKTPSV